jgi:DNA-binding Lrp family transcriptional regulator
VREQGVKMAIVFILINSESGAEREVLKALKEIREVKEVNSVYGVYDIIARLEAKTMEEIKNAINLGIRKINNVGSTMTMIVA